MVGPARSPRWPRRRPDGAPARRCGRGPRGAWPDGHGAEDDQAGEHEIAEGPEARLPEPPHVSELEARLDYGGVAQEREHAPEIARGVEEVGVARRPVTAVREPVLQQRRIALTTKKGRPTDSESRRSTPRTGLASPPGSRLASMPSGRTASGTASSARCRIVCRRMPSQPWWRARRRSRRAAWPERTPCTCSRRRACRRGAAGSSCPPLAAPRTGAWRRRTRSPRRAAARGSEESLQPPIVAAAAAFSYRAGPGSPPGDQSAARR